MSRFFLATLLALIVLVARAADTSATAAAGELSPLTLEQAFALIEQTNVSVLLSREALVQAIEASHQQRANLLPHVELTAQQTRQLLVSNQSGTLNQVGPTNRFDGELTGSFSLFNPAQIAAFIAARTGARSAQFGYEAAVQAALAAVAQAYFAHLHDVHRIAVLDSNVDHAKSLLALAQAQLKAGVATQIDVTRAEAALATAQQQRIQQDTTVYQSELQLKRLLGLGMAPSLQLAEVGLQRVDTEPLALGAEQRAFNLRPDYLSAKIQLDEARQTVRAAEFERLPSVNAFGDYGYARPRAFDNGGKEEWEAGAAVSLPIFEGLRITADRRVALSRERAQEQSLRDLEKEISLELRLAAQDAHSRFAQIALAEKSQQLAEDQLRLASLRFKQGLADNQEVIDAQNGLAVAADNLNDAIFQYNLSRVELARAQGEVRDVLREKTP